MPQLRDYTEALRMWAIPIVAFIMMASMLTSVVYAMRNSFYPVYLDEAGLSKTTIGILMTTGSLISGATGLAISRLSRVIAPLIMLPCAIAGATIAMAATPMTESVIWLAGFAVLFGLLGGPAFPLILSELAREVDVSQQGICVGLRTTVNRLVALVAPVTMGVIAEWLDLRASFLALAGLNLVLIAVFAARVSAARPSRK